MPVDCEGVDRVTLLQELWRNSSTASFFSFAPISAPSEPPHEEFKQSATGYVDYFAGRVIKTDFSEFPNLDPWGYDRDNGVGAMQKIVDKLK